MCKQGPCHNAMRRLQRAEDEVWFVLCCWQELTWTQLELTEPVPPARDAHSAVLDSAGKMWIFGGNSASGSLDDMWRCDVQAQAWELDARTACDQVLRSIPRL